MTKPRRMPADRRAEDCVNRALACLQDAIYNAKFCRSGVADALQREHDSLRAARTHLWPPEESQG